MRNTAQLNALYETVKKTQSFWEIRSSVRAEMKTKVSKRFAVSVRAELKASISEKFAPSFSQSWIKIQSCGRPICLNHQLDGQNVSKAFVVNFDDDDICENCRVKSAQFGKQTWQYNIQSAFFPPNTYV
jgi:hypothetical protein